MINPCEKITRSRNLHQNPLLYTLFNLFFKICITLRHAERAKLSMMQKFISKITFFQLRLKTECNSRFTFHCLASSWMPYMGYWAREMPQSNTCPLQKNLGFQLFSPKTRRPKISGHLKIWPRSITLPMQLSNKQSYRSVCGKWDSNLRNEVSNGECHICLKNSKNFAFFWRELTQIFFDKNITARRSTEWCSID